MSSQKTKMNLNEMVDDIVADIRAKADRLAEFPEEVCKSGGIANLLYGLADRTEAAILRERNPDIDCESCLDEKAWPPKCPFYGEPDGCNDRKLRWAKTGFRGTIEDYGIELTDEKDEKKSEHVGAE